jgi:short-subunit dehydrogenase
MTPARRLQNWFENSQTEVLAMRLEKFKSILGASGLFSLLGLKILKNIYFSMRLDGKVVLITGGSRGLGLILARKIASKNATVVICARDQKELERAEIEIEKVGGKVLSLVCDISDLSQVRSMIQEVLKIFGRIDLLINNAGIIQVGPLNTMGVEDFQAAMKTNFWGTVHPTLEVLPSMIQSGKGSIATICSIGGLVSVPHLLPYSSAKFAQRGFSEGLAAEVEKYGINVSTIFPGLMRTGSYLNVAVKGQKQKEFGWFALGATLPLISMDAERAANKILQSIQQGKRTITIGLPAQILRTFHQFFPKTTLWLMALVNRTLPDEDGSGKEFKMGKDSQSVLTRSPVTVLGEIAATKYNQAG